MESQKVKEMWLTHTPAQIAAKLRIPRSKVYRLARLQGLQSRLEIAREPESPTEGEIKERAAAVRKTWSRAEERSRIVGPVATRWTPPVIRVGEIEPPSYSRV